MPVFKPVDKCVFRQQISRPNVLQYANQKREKGSFNDVTIETGDQTIAANRMILSCCSRFFEAMFDLEMKEKYQNTVQIHGVDGAAVKSVIDFMYSGEVKITSENVMELIAASDYLQVAEVKRFCFEFLESILSSENWFAVYSAAKLYENEHLQNEVYEYVSNNFDDVIETVEFTALSKNDLILFVSKSNRSHAKVESIFKGLVTWCQQDKETRQILFVLLFEELIDLDRISTECLEKVILKEKLVAENNYCLKLVIDYVVQRCKNFGLARIIGLGGMESRSRCVEVCNTSANPSPKFPDLPIALYAHCSLRLRNFVYLIGGSIQKPGKEVALQNVWLVNTNDHVLKWKKVASLNKKREFMGGAVFRDTLVVAGGYNENSGDLNSVEFYQAAFDEWKFAIPLQQARSGCSMVASDQHLFALGGHADDKCSNSVERIANLNNKWIKVQSMQTPRRWFAAVICDEAIYAIGGQTNIAENITTNTVEKYGFDEEKWVYVSSMITERIAHAACVVNGKIYVVGGLNQSQKVVKTIESYDPSADLWSIHSEIDDALFYHSLIAL